MTTNYFKKGVWNVICDVCGVQYKSDEVLKRWDGMIVCKSDFEVRHPLDFIRSITEHSDIPFTRPEGADSFVGPVCTLTGRSSMPGYAMPGCSTPSTKNLG